MAFKLDKGAYDGYALLWEGKDKHFVMKRRVDFTVAANQLAQNEIMGLFNVPAYVLVEEVLMIVRTADTDITDVDIGSYTTAEVAVVADGFIDGLSLAAAGLIRDLADETYSKQNGTFGYMGTADWKIAFQNKDAQTIDAAIVDFYAICVDLR